MLINGVRKKASAAVPWQVTAADAVASATAVLRYLITAAIERQTWSMFLLFTAATHMRPLSVP